MCGFAGVIAWDEKYRCSRETLGKMSAAIAHRGPDGEGFYQSLDGPITPDRPQVSLAFRRLAILDPDPRSNQPFTDGRHWLVFNGEIYNFRELKKELSLLRQDYQWKTTGDTEVLLRAYAVWGEKCVEHLNGMFAFAVWDAAEKSLFLARDRMGQKPLYFAHLAAGFYDSDPRAEIVGSRTEKSVLAFASEPSALLVASWVNRDLFGLGEYLKWGYVNGWSTIYKGIRKVPQGIRERITREKSDGSCYFSGVGKRNTISLIETKNQVQTTRSLVRQAVERQLISDVPLGCFLSGGIDSSVIAACMRSADQNRPCTFSIAFDDPRYDESKYAAAVAKHLGTKHQQFVVKPDAVEDLLRISATFAEPFGDSSSLPTHYLCREVGREVKVALSGDGGDELFCGYDRYRAIAMSSRLDFLPQMIRNLVANTAQSMGPGHPKSVRRRLWRFAVSLQFSAAQRYGSYLEIFSDTLIRQLLGRSYFNVLTSSGSDGAFHSQMLHGAVDTVHAAMASDRASYLPNDLLTKVDRCSMLHGLEVRSPFMDHELVQFAAGLTTDQLLKGGPKRMLREAFADDLPAWVFKRKKMGFAVPIGDWFRGELRSMLRDTLFSSHAFGRSHFDMKVVERLVEEHESKRVDHSQRLYALLMLELWWDTVRE